MLPYSPSTRALNSSVGVAVYMLIAPAMVLRPYSVPCGPRSTSMRSMSNIGLRDSRLRPK